MASGEKSYTQVGNVRAPSKLLGVKWMKQVWSEISQEVIESFAVCGISVSVGGSEDDRIHSIKDGEIALAACSDIPTRTRALHDEIEESDQAYLLILLKMMKNWRTTNLPLKT